MLQRSHQTYRDWLFMDNGISHGPPSSLPPSLPHSVGVAIGKKAIIKNLYRRRRRSCCCRRRRHSTSATVTSLQGHCHRQRRRSSVRSFAGLEIILRQSGRLVLWPPHHHSPTHSLAADGDAAKRVISDGFCAMLEINLLFLVRPFRKQKTWPQVRS